MTFDAAAPCMLITISIVIRRLQLGSFLEFFSLINLLKLVIFNIHEIQPLFLPSFPLYTVFEEGIKVRKVYGKLLIGVTAVLINGSF